MSRSSVLLRVLVALMLMLNGIGGAMASARMLVEHEALAVHGSAATGEEAAPPCHEDMAGTSHDMPAAPEPVAHGDAPDCCGSEHCLCECVQHCCAMPVPMLAGAAPGPDGTAVHPLSDGHPEPVRPRLIRPPIG
ncbi:CopL family metal-binding regulatory protein [Lysobacter sp. TLK-CK17T]|uniref:CopL family metal-binding regulatory protein n=2 Tax=Marilutibacter chinensis TaxID=2912247 RepID=A0ABS9HN31_9GAMM|nr:CopL family metal-binding regulatory protein [Lysobacter chinensis]